MHLSTTSPRSHLIRPWQARDLPYLIRLALLFVWSLCFLIAIASFGTFILNVDPFISGIPPTQIRPGATSLLMSAALSFGGSILTMTALFPYIKDPTHFSLPYPPVPATLAGHPFLIHFRRQLRSRSYIDEGVIQFNEGSVQIEGPIEPTGVLRTVLFVLMIVIFPFALIPVVGILVKVGFAWLRARFTGITQVEIAYAEMSDIRVKGCRVQLTCQRSQPERITFYVAQQDGERLYHELYRYVPASVRGWSPTPVHGS
jgi:hypothetical protein